MPQFHWRIPVHGCKGDLTRPHYTRGTWGPQDDGNLTPYVAAGHSDGVPYHEYLLEVARAAEIAGFDGALIPSFPDSEDPWVIAAAIARHTKTLRFMIAYQPMWFDPVYWAKASASLQRLSGGRLMFNVITGGGGPRQLWWGDRIAHGDRYTRTTEAIDVLKGVWNGGPFSYDGKFFQVKDAYLPEPLAGQVWPELYFVGSSDVALAAQGKHADYDLTHLEPFDNLKVKFARVQALAATHGRTVRPGVRFNIIARPTAEEAWDYVERAWAGVDWDAVEKKQAENGRGDGVGSWRASPKRGDTVQQHVVEELWAGFGTLGSQGSPLGFVGSYKQAAGLIDKYIDIGVEGFVLSSTPALEEALRVGEEVLPLVRGRTAAPRRATA